MTRRAVAFGTLTRAVAALPRERELSRALRVRTQSILERLKAGFKHQPEAKDAGIYDLDGYKSRGARRRSLGEVPAFDGQDDPADLVATASPDALHLWQLR